MSVDIENNLSEAGWCAQAPCVRSPLDYSPSVLEIPSEAGGYSDETWVCSACTRLLLNGFVSPFVFSPCAAPMIQAVAAMAKTQVIALLPLKHVAFSCCSLECTLHSTNDQIYSATTDPSMNSTHVSFIAGHQKGSIRATHPLCSTKNTLAWSGLIAYAKKERPRQPQAFHTDNVSDSWYSLPVLTTVAG